MNKALKVAAVKSFGKRDKSNERDGRLVTSKDSVHLHRLVQIHKILKISMTPAGFVMTGRKD